MQQTSYPRKYGSTLNTLQVEILGMGKFSGFNVKLLKIYIYIIKHSITKWDILLLIFPKRDSW